MITTVKDGWEDDEEGWSFDDSDSELNNINSIENKDEEGSFEFTEPTNVDKYVHHYADVTNAAINYDQDSIESRSQVAVEHLSNYVNELQNTSALVKRLNNEFTKKTNTMKAAKELFEYYSSRPNLKSYTLETELPRMQYTVYPDHHSSALTDTSIIQARYSSKDSAVTTRRTMIQRNAHCEDMIWRAANQSLLSDIIAVLTHIQPNPLIRMDLLITATAQHCHFILSFNKSSPHHNALHCTCELSIQIPNLNQTFVNITIDIDFSPFIMEIDANALPFICRVTHIHPFSFSPDEIKRMAETIAHDFLPPEKDNHYATTDIPLQNSTNSKDHLFSLRDSYLLSTAATQVVANTANAATHMAVDTRQGLKSAFHQMDTAVNIQSKFKFFQNVFSLPSAELLNECEAFENEAKKEYCNLQQTIQHNVLPKLSKPSRSDIVQPSKTQGDVQAQLYARDEIAKSIRHDTNGLRLYRIDHDESKKSDKLEPSSSNDVSFRFYKRNETHEKEGTISQKERDLPTVLPTPGPPLSNQGHNSRSDVQDHDIDTESEIKEGWSDDELDFNLNIDDLNCNHQTKNKLSSTCSKPTIKSVLTPLTATNTRSTYDATSSFSLFSQDVVDNMHSNSSNKSISSDAILLEADDYHTNAKLEFDDQDGIIPTRKRWIRPVRSIFF